MVKRSSGVLMHITSLPGKFGIGTLGEEAYQFIEFLKETEQSYWQILPLTTTSYGDSPYQSFSAVAGNTNLIDFDRLRDEGLLEEPDYNQVTFTENSKKVDYARLFVQRRPILEKAVQNFPQNQDQEEDFQKFLNDNQTWLYDFAEFMAIKEHFGNVSLLEWPDLAIKNREPEALNAYREKVKDGIRYHLVSQYFFFKQWFEVKDAANQAGIKIIGDMPIYVASDSVEMWTMPQLFKTDEFGNPKYVAGVPADEFSDDGQYWGNPIYDWDYHKQEGFKWWIFRIQEALKVCDMLRIDHFKGFSDFWQISSKESTARYGKWVSGPGYDLFKAVKDELGDLPIIAENLGYIDEKAEKLLSDTGFPGMKILEFAFLDTTGNSVDIPHYYTQHSIAYTGTHDNDVIRGWYDDLTDEQKSFTDAYTHRHEDEPISQAMLRTLYASVSDITIACMQDILDLSTEARMNIPNTLGGNWQWRMTKDELTEDKIAFFKAITTLYHRAKH